MPLAKTADKVPTLVAGIIRQLDDAEDPSYWTRIQRIEELGEKALPTLRASLASASESARLACAKILLEIGEEKDAERAIQALLELLRAKSTSVRVAAIDLLSVHGEAGEVLQPLRDAFGKTVNPTVLIPLARALWEIDRVEVARDRLVELLKSRNPTVRREVALTLAEMEYFEGDVREILQHLSTEPSPEGRRAAILHRLAEVTRQLDRRIDRGEALLEGVDPLKLLKIKDARIRSLEKELSEAQQNSAAGEGNQPSAMRASPLLEEVIRTIQKHYVNEDWTDRKKLIESAVNGIMDSLDPFSSFMNIEQAKRFEESISGEYYGIGAQIGKQGGEGHLQVRKLIYGGPAHNSGLLAGDVIREVNGEDTSGLELDGIIKRLKGPENSEVTLSVARPGWGQTKSFVIGRSKVAVPTVYEQLLPGKIGYIQVTKFGDTTQDEFKAALDEFDTQRIVGLILDLRGNPGGRRDTAVAVVDEFVSNDKLPILIQKGRNGEQVEKATPKKRPAYPMVVLVNERSASASEIVSGALQDFGRATIVGKKTFGKGSVQRVFHLSPDAQEELGGEGRLRLTVQYYFLPLRRGIHTTRDRDGNVVEPGGVQPDIEVSGEEISLETAEERERLLFHPRVLEYVTRNENLLRDLYLQGDSQDATIYPNLAGLKEQLQTSLDDNELRLLVRFHVRRRLEDERGHEYPADFQDDVQLQSAIVQILKKLGETPGEYSAYRFLEKTIQRAAAIGDGGKVREGGEESGERSDGGAPAEPASEPKKPEKTGAGKS